jgi:hypothetical protein
VQRRLSRGVCGRAINLGAVFSTEGAAAMVCAGEEMARRGLLRGA